MFDIDLSFFALSPAKYPLSALFYHFFHVNIFHAVMNAWCLLGIAFYYNTSLREYLWAFAIASSFPACLCLTPSVGLSGMLYALMGLVYFRVLHKLYFLACIVGSNAIAFFVGGFGIEVHAYCFLSAVINELAYSKIFRL